MLKRQIMANPVPPVARMSRLTRAGRRPCALLVRGNRVTKAAARLSCTHVEKATSRPIDVHRRGAAARSFSAWFGVRAMLRTADPGPWWRPVSGIAAARGRPDCRRHQEQLDACRDVGKLITEFGHSDSSRKGRPLPLMAR